MKRSRRTGLLALSTASVLVLAGCYEEPPVSLEKHESAVFSSIEACLADAGKTGASKDVPAGETMSPMQKLQLACVEDWNKAQDEHEKNAPRYSSLAQCEAEFGTGNCGAPGASGGTTVVNNGGGDSGFFMPMMMGYMLGSMNQPSSYPVYSNRSGGYRSTAPYATQKLKSSTSTFVSPTGSRASLSGTKVTGGKIEAPKAAMTKSTRSRSSGFGASRSSTSRSSFGG